MMFLLWTYGLHFLGVHGLRVDSGTRAVLSVETPPDERSDGDGDRSDDGRGPDDGHKPGGGGGMKLKEENEDSNDDPHPDDPNSDGTDHRGPVIKLKMQAGQVEDVDVPLEDCVKGFNDTAEECVCTSVEDGTKTNNCAPRQTCDTTDGMCLAACDVGHSNDTKLDCSCAADTQKLHQRCEPNYGCHADGSCAAPKVRTNNCPPAGAPNTADEACNCHDVNLCKRDTFCTDDGSCSISVLRVYQQVEVNPILPGTTDVVLDATGAYKLITDSTIPIHSA